MTDKPTVIEALTAVMAEVQPVGKKQRNTEQGYNFRGIDAVVNAVGPVLRKHGVIVLPVLEDATHRDVLTSKGKPSRESTVRVRYTFYGPCWRLDRCRGARRGHGLRRQGRSQGHVGRLPDRPAAGAVHPDR